MAEMKNFKNSKRRTVAIMKNSFLGGEFPFTSN